MSEFAAIVIFAILVFGFIVVLGLVMNPRVRAKISLPWNTRLEIDARRNPAGRPLPPFPQKTAPALSRAAPVLPHMWLAIQRPSRSDWIYELDGRQVFVGRSLDNDIRLTNDPQAEPKHAVFYIEQNRCYVKNLSRRGTRVNNRLVDNQKLGDGNTIRMGATCIIFHERN